MNIEKLFRPNIQAMSGYVPGEQPKGKVYIKLNTNENPYPPSAKAIEALNNFDTDRLRRYPTPASDPLVEAAAKVYGLKNSNVIAGNGSDDILNVIFRAFLDTDETAAWLDPSYSLYPVLCDIQGAKYKGIELDEKFEIPSDALEQAKDCKIFFITRPNAPTGNLFPKEEVENICANFNGIVIIDEAYGDFAEDNCIDLIQKYDNVIVTRTFSKSYSLAGMRIGLGLASEAIISGLHKVRDSYNVNFLSQVIGEAALLDQDYFNECTAKIIKTREWVEEALYDMGLVIIPSQTNFIFAKTPIEASIAFEKLRDAGYLVRYFSTERCKEYLRVSIGTDEEMKGFCQALKTILEEAK